MSSKSSSNVGRKQVLLWWQNNEGPLGTWLFNIDWTEGLGKQRAVTTGGHEVISNRALLMEGVESNGLLQTDRTPLPLSYRAYHPQAMITAIDLNHIYCYGLPKYSYSRVSMHAGTLFGHPNFFLHNYPNSICPSKPSPYSMFPSFIWLIP